MGGSTVYVPTQPFNRGYLTCLTPLGSHLQPWHPLRVLLQRMDSLLGFLLNTDRTMILFLATLTLV